MVLIISHNNGSANSVIDWLISKNVEVHRLNPYFDKIRIIEIQITEEITDIELEFEIYNTKTRLSDYSGVWIWHSHLRFDNCDPSVKEDTSSEVINIIQKSLSNHHQILTNYFSEFLSCFTSNTIGNYKLQNLNKLEVLLKAKMLGIDVPESYIISNKNQLFEILEKKDLITKPYHEVVYPIYNNNAYQNYTSIVSKLQLENDANKENLYPTLVQENLDKLFEIRSFFLYGNFYSMAIFSQDSSKTKLDFRNYDFENANRTIPITLPKPLTRKINKLFNILNLNSGSIDLIYTKDNKYKFLEINPVGQFGMVSIPCNYYLENIIAETLIHGRN